MEEKIEADMTHIQEFYKTLATGIGKLKEEVVSIQGEIRNVGESMSSRMQDLHSTTNDIESVAGKSLENQRQLLDGQSWANSYFSSVVLKCIEKYLSIHLLKMMLTKCTIAGKP
jgi:septal ring factor EnvC (AmiA/AmiB activator)